MTHRQEAARALACSREIAARWCALAEQRLEHLSEMFETGRWRRYHSEIAFLENIQEAKRAVQTWRAIASGEDVAAAAASVTSAFGWSPATLSRTAPRDQAQTVQPKAVHIVPETAVPVRLDPTPDVLAEVTEASLAPLAASGERVPVTPAPDAMATLLQQFLPSEDEIVAAPERVVEFTFSLDGIEAKYPLLRNTF